MIMRLFELYASKPKGIRLGHHLVNAVCDAGNDTRDDMNKLFYEPDSGEAMKQFNAMIARYHWNHQDIKVNQKYFESLKGV